MPDIPELNKELDAVTFRSYYYLKDELVSFCRENDLPVSGGKIELTERIAYYLETGKCLKAAAGRKAPAVKGNITENRYFKLHNALQDA